MISLYPVPQKAQRPWWAEKLAFEQTKSVFGWASALFLVLSIAYGIWKINEQTFVPERKDVKVLVSVVDGSKVSGDALRLPGEEESRRLSLGGAIKVSILVFWIVAPPIWFWLEYVGLYRYEDARESADQFTAVGQRHDSDLACYPPPIQIIGAFLQQHQIGTSALGKPSAYLRATTLP